ncbi:MAG: cytochrome c-type biogenesis protein CcmH [Deltaproteobacteria bacterium]|nr:cytochrome c-type biogenesis protein CcmH [Deltaproteobacteria bacterium]
MNSNSRKSGDWWLVTGGWGTDHESPVTSHQSPLFILLLLFLISLAACAPAPMDPEDRVQQLGGQIRCPICRGTSIADSPSEMAREMMAVIRDDVVAGKSDAAILEGFVARYGEWAMLQPRAEGMNLIIWLFPATLLLGGGIAIIVMARRSRKETP